MSVQSGLRGSVQLQLRRSVQRELRRSVRHALRSLVRSPLRMSVRWTTALACVGAFAVACAADNTPADERIVPTPDSTIAPTRDSATAPTNDSAVAPTNDSGIASTRDSENAPASDSGLTSSTAAQAAAPVKFDGARAYEHLRRQVGFGPRPAGSAALGQTRQYILSELKAAGIQAREDAWDATTPLGRVRMVNIIATIPGRRPERIALATHYDTKLVREFRFVGASDAASSTAAVLELGRLLKGRENEFTIELLFFDGEEAVVEWYRNNDNTYGSRHYVETAQKAGTLGGLKALVLLDMIGDRNLNIRRDSNSTAWLTDIVWTAAGRLGYRANFLPEETTIEDDHLPFLKAGVPSVDIIDLDYPAWHTAQDDLDHVSARSLQVVGDVVLAAWPDIEKRLASTR